MKEIKFRWIIYISCSRKELRNNENPTLFVIETNFSDSMIVFKTIFLFNLNNRFDFGYCRSFSEAVVSCRPMIAENRRLFTIRCHATEKISDTNLYVSNRSIWSKVLDKMYRLKLEIVNSGKLVSKKNHFSFIFFRLLYLDSRRNEERKKLFKNSGLFGS